MESEAMNRMNLAEVGVTVDGNDVDISSVESTAFNPASHMNLQIKLQMADIKPNGTEQKECPCERSKNENGMMTNGEVNTCSDEECHSDQQQHNSDSDDNLNNLAVLSCENNYNTTNDVSDTTHEDTSGVDQSVDVTSLSKETIITSQENSEDLSCLESDPKPNIENSDCESKHILSSIIFTDGTVIQPSEKLFQHPTVTGFLKELNIFLINAKRDKSLNNIIVESASLKDSTRSLKNEYDALTEVCKQLESQNQQLKYSLKQTEEKLNSHDNAAKRTISRLQNDSDSKIKELIKKCSAAENEKQSSVMNYARREKELLDLRRQKESAEQFARNAGKERDKANGQLKGLRIELAKLKNGLDRKENEGSVQNKEIEKLKEDINSQIIKVKWAQNKLKSEVDSHKETKEKCEKMTLEIQHAKEETEQIRKNCQEMIKTYQESEEIKSNALDIQLKEKMQSLTEKEADNKDLCSVIKQKTDELNALKIKHKALFEEHQVLKSNTQILDEQRIKNEQVLSEYEEVLNKQKVTASQMNEKMKDIFDLQSQVEDLNTTIEALTNDLQDATDKRDAVIKDLACKELKEQELLDFTEKVSSKNSQLTVELEELNTKFLSQNEQVHSYEEKMKQLQEEVNNLASEKEKENNANVKSQTLMSNRLEEKEKTICQLLLQLEELKDEMRTVKRKNNAAVKDLTRQLNQVKRKVDNVDSLSTVSAPISTGHSGDGGSMGSRASSTNSLDRISSYSPENHGGLHYDHVSVPETAVAGPDSLDRQMLIERIVRLQQIHAKKNEKIDFLNEHVHQLIEALQKKQRLIQHYIMREESGALAPPREQHDHKSRSGLTLELSMEINQKMQSVLEDTLLKNITLKESLEMLGKEVERLTAQSTAKHT